MSWQYIQIKINKYTHTAKFLQSQSSWDTIQNLPESPKLYNITLITALCPIKVAPKSIVLQIASLLGDKLLVSNPNATGAGNISIRTILKCRVHEYRINNIKI